MIAKIVYLLTFIATVKHVVNFFTRYRYTKSFVLGLMPNRHYFMLSYPDRVVIFVDVWSASAFSADEWLTREILFRRIFRGISGINNAADNPFPLVCPWREKWVDNKRITISRTTEIQWLWTTPDAIKKLFKRSFDPKETIEHVSNLYDWVICGDRPAGLDNINK